MRVECIVAVRGQLTLRAQTHSNSDLRMEVVPIHLTCHLIEANFAQKTVGFQTKMDYFLSLLSLFSGGSDLLPQIALLLGGIWIP